MTTVTVVIKPEKRTDKTPIMLRYVATCSAYPGFEMFGYDYEGLLTRAIEEIRKLVGE